MYIYIFIKLFLNLFIMPHKVIYNIMIKNKILLLAFITYHRTCSSLTHPCLVPAQSAVMLDAAGAAPTPAP